MPLRRRTLLSTAATVPLAATAGCTDGLGFGDGNESTDTPAYARWVPASAAENGDSSDDGPGDGVFYVYVDWADIDDLRSVGEDLPTDDSPFEGTPGGNPMEGAADALIAVPTFGLLLASLGAGFQLGVYGFVGGLFDDLVGDEPAGGADDAPTATPGDETADIGTLERMLFTGRAIVVEGSFDLEAIEEAATAEEFERAGDHRGARLYEGSGGDGLVTTEGLAFAAREDALVFGSSPSGSLTDEEPPSKGGTARSHVETVLDVEAGEKRRLADRNDDAAWALGRAGHGQIAVGVWGEFESDSKGDGGFDDPGFGGGFDGPSESLPTADGQVYSLTLSESESTGDMAAAYPEGNVPDRETVASSVGNTADEREVEIDGQRVSVTGTWNQGDQQKS